MQPASRIAFVMMTMFIFVDGGVGIGSITRTGRAPPDVRDMKITPKGFRLTFTEPLVPQAPSPAQDLAEKGKITVYSSWLVSVVYLHEASLG